MLIKTGERWQCGNPACRHEILVESSGKIEGIGPLCACGGLLKKSYASPALRYLEFLRGDETPAVSVGGRDG